MYALEEKKFTKKKSDIKDVIIFFVFFQIYGGIQP
jgi:hypothetical protein